MSQFTVVDLITAIVSLSYLSLDEEMEIDDLTQAMESEADRDSDIEVLACYSEAQPFQSQSVAGRFMTSDPTGCLDDLSISEALHGPSSAETSCPSSELIDQVLGNNPPPESFVPLSQQPNAHCSRLLPIPDTPQSPPIHEQGPISTTPKTHGPMINSPAGPIMPTLQV